MTGLWVGGVQVPPLVLPVAITYAVLAGLALHRGRGRWPVVVPWVLLLGALAVTATATLTPPLTLDNPELYGEFVGRQCAVVVPDMSWTAITSGDQRLLNVALFVPIGLLAVLVSRTLRLVVVGLVIAVVAALPVVIEAIQWAFPSLLRACDTTDLGDNYVGLLTGLAVGGLGVGLRWAAGRNAGRVGP